jgi:hypothetical protein
VITVGYDVGDRYAYHPTIIISQNLILLLLLAYCMTFTHFAVHTGAAFKDLCSVPA